MANVVEASELAGAVETSLNEVSPVESENTPTGTVADVMVEAGDTKDVCKDGIDKDLIKEDGGASVEKGEDPASVETEIFKKHNDKEVEKIADKEKDEVESKDNEKTSKEIDVKEEEKVDEKAVKKVEESTEKDETKVVTVTEKLDEEQEKEEVEEKAIDTNENEGEGKDATVKEGTEIIVDNEIKDESPVEVVNETSPESLDRELHEEIDGEEDGELDEEEEDEDEGEEEEEEERGDEVENSEEKIEKPLDDDQDRRNPQYIPKGGAFYEHDNRTSLEDVENKDPQETDKKKKSWKVSKESERWLHDCYNESEQLPKSTAEIIEAYGYDIRNEDAPPRARRRRKYGRGPDKYERSWEDEQAYLVKQNNNGRRGKKKPFGKEEFPPLPNQKLNSPVSKPVQRSSPRRKEDEAPEKPRNVKINGSDRSPTTSHSNRPSYSGNHSGNHSNLPGFHSNKKNLNHVNKKINDDDIKPFRNDGNKWKNNNLKQGKPEDFPRPIRTQSIRPSDPPFRRSIEVNRSSIKESDVSHITDEMSQMSFHVRMGHVRDIRPKASNGQDETKIHESEVDSPANRQNPKRYSKIRKGFTGIFPPEEVSELSQSELHKLQQEQQKSQHISMAQPLNMQNVMKRYAGTYDFVPGNTSYLGARPIISGIPQQAMSPQGIHQQTLSPQGIPQQALSPQVTGLQTIELQQNPLAQPNFVPHANYVQSMYIGMDAHYPSDVVAPYNEYPSYSGNQTGDVYQPARGITYYSRECQSSGQKLPPPPPRQKTPIPIVPPGKH